MVSKNLKEYQFLCEDYDFDQTHRSHIINLNEMTEFSFEDGGMVTLSDRSVIPVSSRQVSDFVKRLKNQ